jgi:hypothetical protein
VDLLLQRGHPGRQRAERRAGPHARPDAVGQVS